MVLLDLSNCKSITRLPDSVLCLSKLEVLKLNDCTELQKLPDSIDRLSSLRELLLSGCENLEALPSFITRLRDHKCVFKVFSIESLQKSFRFGRFEITFEDWCKGDYRLVFDDHSGVWMHGGESYEIYDPPGVCRKRDDPLGISSERDEPRSFSREWYTHSGSSRKGDDDQWYTHPKIFTGKFNYSNRSQARPQKFSNLKNAISVDKLLSSETVVLSGCVDKNIRRECAVVVSTKSYETRHMLFRMTKTFQIPDATLAAPTIIRSHVALLSRLRLTNLSLRYVS